METRAKILPFSGNGRQPNILESYYQTFAANPHEFRFTNPLNFKLGKDTFERSRLTLLDSDSEDRCYLHGRCSFVQTDHRALSYIGMDGLERPENVGHENVGSPDCEQSRSVKLRSKNIQFFSNTSKV